MAIYFLLSMHLLNSEKVAQNNIANKKNLLHTQVPKGPMHLFKYLLAFVFFREELSLNNICGSSHCGAVEMNPTRNREVAGLILGLAQWVRNLVLLSAAL